jgi:carbonic anhydrase/acetyltransferase-like protein (isoleucine patch superfamily)
VNRIVIGRGTNVQDLTMGHVTHKTSDKPEGSALIIGNYVTVGHSVVLHGCSIGNECLIGIGSIILDDVVIPDHVMIGAGSLVSPGKVLESGMLWPPAKAVRALTPRKRPPEILGRALHPAENNYPNHLPGASKI